MFAPRAPAGLAFARRVELSNWLKKRPTLLDNKGIKGKAEESQISC